MNKIHSNFLLISTLITLVSAWSVVVIAKAWPAVWIQKDPPSIKLDRQTQVTQRANTKYNFRKFRRGDTLASAWMGDPPQPLCVGWGVYDHESIFSTIQWKESYFHLCGGVADPINPGTPLLIDLGRNGFRLGKKGVGVEFDIDSLGYTETFQWVAVNTDDAFLVRDINHNGRIDNGSELLGSGTYIGEYDQKAPNGYYALVQFDSVRAFGGNQDGVISAEDGVWSSLQLWVDSNANAETEPGELHRLEDYGIAVIDTNYRKTRNRKDRAGNTIPYWSFIYLDTDQRPRRMLMADVVFRRLDSP